MAGSNVKFLRGTAKKYDEYKVQSLINSNSFYLIDEKDLYLGLIKLSNEEDINAVKDRVSLLEENHSECVKHVELLTIINPISDKIKEVEEAVTEVKTVVGDENTGLIKEVNELKLLVLNIKPTIETHSKLLEGLSPDLTVKSLIESSAVAADEAKQIAQSAKIEVETILSKVYTKDEVDDIVASKEYTMSWQDMEQTN